QVALTGLVLLAAAGFCRLPAEPLPAIRRRSTQSHVGAVATLWSKRREPGLPLEALLRVMDERAPLRLRRNSDEPFMEWVSLMRPTLLKRAREAWSSAQQLSSQDARPSASEARRAAASLKRVEKDVLRW